MYRRVLVALAIGVISATLCAGYQASFQRGAGDITWPLCAARALIEGGEPYACRFYMSDGRLGPTNPITTAVAVLPLAWLPPTIAAGVFFGISSALLAFALTRNGTWWRLLAFLALPYWQALQVVQWSPLLLAVALLPGLLPLVLVKPQIGLPIALTRFTWRRGLACAVCVLLSFAIKPDWLWLWQAQIRTYDGFLPLLTLPGVLLALACLRWRDDRMRFLLLMAVMPQRLFYDQLVLWLLPRTRREMLVVVITSWLGFYGWMIVPQFGAAWAVALTYLPLLIMLWADQRTPQRGRTLPLIGVHQQGTETR